jgi:cytidylate kinase
MSKIITITGDLGSGKSTVSAILCRRLGYEYINTGKIQRDIAARYGMTTVELNRYSETHPEIDAEIDATFKSLNGTSGLVIDSRLAWFFIPDSLKVFLAVDIKVAAARIAADMLRTSEQYTSAEEAVHNIMDRKASENKRYMELYGADCSNLANFDLIIDTSLLTPEQTAEQILEAFITA